MYGWIKNVSLLVGIDVCEVVYMVIYVALEILDVVSIKRLTIPEGALTSQTRSRIDS